MITRRDALKIAAGFAASNSAPFAVSPEEAAALLAEPISAGSARSAAAWTADPLDPVQFAESLDDIDIGEWFAHGAAEEMVAYKQARNALIDRYPEFADPPGTEHPFTLMDEAAFTMWCVAWMAGVRMGAACEHLRLALVTPRQECAKCHGNGRLWNGTPFRHREDGTIETTCAACDGVGTVATLAPSLAAVTP